MATQNASPNDAEVDAATRRMYEMTLRRKVMFLRRSIHIVEQLSEKDISENALFKAIQFIDQNQYADVVHERVSVQLCGYSLCSNTLGEIPKQQFRICRITQQVYDITNLKNFCSPWCLQASEFLEQQLPRTPVWSRTREERISLTRIRLLAADEPGSQGTPLGGDGEVTVMQLKERGRRSRTVGSHSDELVTCTGEDDSGNEEEVEEEIDSDDDDIEDWHSISRPSSKKPIPIVQPTKLPDPPIIIKENPTGAALSTTNLMAQQTPKTDTPLETLSSNTLSQMATNRKEESSRNTNDSMTSCARAVDRVSDWFTPLSHAYLYGDPEEEKLNSLAPVVAENSAIEGNSYDEKVAKFFGKKGTDASTEKSSGAKSVDSRSMPLVDSVSQKVIRRQILIERFNVAMPLVLSLLNVNSRYVMDSLRELVGTFNLTSKNLTLRPLEWKIVCLLLIKLISCKEKELVTIVNAPEFHDLITGYFESRKYFHEIVDQLSRKHM